MDNQIKATVFVYIVTTQFIRNVFSVSSVIIYSTMPLFSTNKDISELIGIYSQIRNNKVPKPSPLNHSFDFELDFRTIYGERLIM